ncbi:MAG: hypothetical protein IIY21_04640 [Clostridiales bacterium]|nr:hypothetical protein [Clostridiales bacterium]MBQ1573825.1 hypothetical protein [Clostridiales bacterium]
MAQIKYISSLVEYKDYPIKGYSPDKNVPMWTVVHSATLKGARKYLYNALSHNGNNIKGNFYGIIRDSKHRFVGEVMNTVDGTRYWYPSNDGKYASAGKYVLYKDGSIGKRLR